MQSGQWLILFYLLLRTDGSSNSKSCKINISLPLNNSVIYSSQIMLPGAYLNDELTINPTAPFLHSIVYDECEDGHVFCLRMMNIDNSTSAGDVSCYKIVEFTSGNISILKTVTVPGRYMLEIMLSPEDTVPSEFVIFDAKAKVQFRPEKTFTLVNDMQAVTKMTIGRGTYGAFSERDNDHVLLMEAILMDEEPWTIRIGQFCSIAQRFQVLLNNGGGHRYDEVGTFPFEPMIAHARQMMLHSGETEEELVRWLPGRRRVSKDRHKSAELVIGNDVWIGLDVRIVGGVTVGHGAVVGAYSVIREDVPPYAIVVGNPARVVKFRFPPEVVEKLLRIKWWDWSDEEVAKVMPWNDDIEAFIRYAEEERFESQPSNNRSEIELLAQPPS